MKSGVAVLLQLGQDGRIDGVEDDHGPLAARVHVGEQVLEQLDTRGVEGRRRGRVLAELRDDPGCLRLHPGDLRAGGGACAPGSDPSGSIARVGGPRGVDGLRAEVGRDLPEVASRRGRRLVAAGSTMLVVRPALTNQM